MIRRLPSGLVTRHLSSLAAATRLTRQHLLFAFAAAGAVTQQVETWSHRERTWRTPDAVVDALAASYVASPATADAVTRDVRFLQDLGDAPTILAYFSTRTQESGIMLRDIAWLTERFRSRGLRVVAICVDGLASRDEVVAEAEWREYPYEWLIDSPEHARRISQSRDMPLGFLVLHGKVVLHSFGIVPEQGRTIFGGVRIQMMLDDSLPK